MSTYIHQWYGALSLGTYGELQQRGFNRAIEGGAFKRYAEALLELRDTALTKIFARSYQHICPPNASHRLARPLSFRYSL